MYLIFLAGLPARETYVRNIQPFAPAERICLFIGGYWNSYTDNAKEILSQQRTGLYTSSEVNGARWKNEFWSYENPDKTVSCDDIRRERN